MGDSLTGVSEKDKKLEVTSVEMMNVDECHYEHRGIKWFSKGRGWEF